MCGVERRHNQRGRIVGVWSGCCNRKSGLELFGEVAEARGAVVRERGAVAGCGGSVRWANGNGGDWWAVVASVAFVSCAVGAAGSFGDFIDAYHCDHFREPRRTGGGEGAGGE
jgi:hypothetical protein